MDTPQLRRLPFRSSAAGDFPFDASFFTHFFVLYIYYCNYYLLTTLTVGFCSEGHVDFFSFTLLGRRLITF